VQDLLLRAKHLFVAARTVLEVAVPLCRTPEERRFIQRFILDRIVFSYLYWWPSNEPPAEKIIADCLERLRLEGNTHLLRKKNCPQSSKS
jgi:hypothetical protein